MEAFTPDTLVREGPAGKEIFHQELEGAESNSFGTAGAKALRQERGSHRWEQAGVAERWGRTRLSFGSECSEKLARWV